jgi:hypothetical protein
MRIEDLPASAIAQMNPLEHQWATWVIARAKENDYLVVHFRKAQSAKGFRTPVQGHTGAPDLLLARDGDVLLPELKKNDAYPRADQREWLRHLGPHGCVWRPRGRRPGAGSAQAGVGDMNQPPHPRLEGNL